MKGPTIDISQWKGSIFNLTKFPSLDLRKIIIPLLLVRL